MDFFSEILDRRTTVKLIEVKKENKLKNLKLKDCKNSLYIVSDSFESWDIVNKECHRFIFKNCELKYNILENNKSVPLYKILSKYENDKSKLPVVPSYDPVVRRMNIKPGVILEIDGRICTVG